MFQLGANNLIVQGCRVISTDISDSFHILKYNPTDMSFLEIADDILPRWITAVCALDYETYAGADKFENFFVCRMPPGMKIKCFILNPLKI